jgi:hypothetical protein
MDPNLLITNITRGAVVCYPAEWSDVGKFVLFNYGVHAVTVRTQPGATTLISILYAFFAFFMPYFGAMRAIVSITRCPVLVRGDALKTAAKSGALCMIMKFNGTTAQAPAPFEGMNESKLYV